MPASRPKRCCANASPTRNATSSKRAVKRTRLCTTPCTRPALAGSSPRCGDPDSALAVPIKVHDETVAVIYAEDANHTPSDAAAFGQRAKVAELLRRQAVPILEKLVLEPKVLAELRAYATLLLDELEH